MNNTSKNSTIALSALGLIVIVAFVSLNGLGNVGSLGKSLSAAASFATLSTADNFAVLAGSAITNVPTAVITGDVGLSPTTGAGIGLTTAQVTGTIYAVDGAGPLGSVNNPGLLTIAKNDLVNTYNNLSAQSAGAAIPTELGGTTVRDGVYNSAAGDFQITGTLTLDGQGDPNAVFIFKTASTLVTANSSHVNLINGAQACNVFWLVGSSATLGTSSDFKGNIVALVSITDNGGSTVVGRLLARNGAVALNGTHVTTMSCSTPLPAGASGPLIIQVPPLISVVKVPTPLALPKGPGLVTYDYTVLNVGTVPMGNIKVVDNKCPTVTYVSGDTNNDMNLDVSETWKYKCSTTLTQTTTNTVVATGQANGFTVTDAANATVVVGSPLPPPLIHVIKKPNLFILLSSGGNVTYSYAVTNPGTVALSNVGLVDNKCSSISNHSGDTNNNNLLDVGETWIYTCQTNLTQTTTNIATATGSANGLTVSDVATATVVVNSPTLPKTGYPPENPWNKIIPIGIMVILTAVYIARMRNAAQ